MMEFIAFTGSGVSSHSRTPTIEIFGKWCQPRRAMTAVYLPFRRIDAINSNGRCRGTRRRQLEPQTAKHAYAVTLMGVPFGATVFVAAKLKRGGSAQR
jgi:hypothetical protein